MYISIDTIFAIILGFVLVSVAVIATLKMYYTKAVKGKVKVQLRREWGEDELYICKADGMTVEPPIGKKAFIMKPICAADSYYPEGLPKWLAAKCKQAWWYEGDVNAIIPYRDKAKIYNNQGEVLDIIPGEPLYSPVTPAELKAIKKERWTEVSVAESQKAEGKLTGRDLNLKWYAWAILSIILVAAGAGAYFGYMGLQYLIAMYGA